MEKERTPWSLKRPWIQPGEKIIRDTIFSMEMDVCVFTDIR